MEKSTKLSFWFPLLLPGLMGMILAFAKLPSDLSETITRYQLADAKQESPNAEPDSADGTGLHKQLADAKQESPNVEPDSADGTGLHKQLADAKQESPNVEPDSADGTDHHKQEMDELLKNGKKFLRRVSEGVVLSIIAVDIWALTTLFGVGSGARRRLPYEYPVLGIILHFILVLVVAASEAVGEDRYEDETLVVSMVAMIGALCVGFWVRRGVWVCLEKHPSDEVS